MHSIAILDFDATISIGEPPSENVRNRDKIVGSDFGLRSSLEEGIDTDIYQPIAFSGPAKETSHGWGFPDEN